MKERILNCPIGKLPVKRMGILMLAFLCLLTMLPWQQARADDPVKDGTEYEWHLIAKQSDLPKSGTFYPMLLIFQDFNGNYYYLKTLKEHTAGNHTLWRDGLDKAQDSDAPIVEKRFRKFLQDNGYPDIYAPEFVFHDGDEIFRLLEATARFGNEDRESACINNHYQTEPLKSGVTVNYIQPDYLSPSDAQTLGINPELKEFTTKTLVTNWEVMNEGGQNKHKEHYIYIRCGDQYMYDEGTGTAELDMRKYDSDDADDYMYSLYTSDLGGSRYKYTPDGYCQIYWLDSGGFDSGLVWDTAGNLIGTIEDDSSCYSIFKMYYATKRSVSIIDKDYIVPAGSVFYADNNSVIADGVNLYIAPGAVMSVNGVLHNNGTINVLGTMIMNPGSLVTSGMNDFNNTGQINVYNGDVEIPGIIWTKDEDVSKLREYFNKSEMEMKKQLDQLYQDMVEVKQQMNSLDGRSNEYKATQELYTRMMKEYFDFEEVYTNRFVTDPESTIKELEAQYQTKEYTFSDCEGILILLEDSILLLPDKSESRLNLYHGATCVNNGTMILPTGLNVWDAELVNYASGHIFLGYSHPTNVANANAITFKDRGTGDARIVGATTLENAVLKFDFGDKMMVVAVAPNTNLGLSFANKYSIIGQFPSHIRNEGVIKSNTLGVDVRENKYCKQISGLLYEDFMSSIIPDNNGIINVATYYVIG